MGTQQHTIVIFGIQTGRDIATRHLRAIIAHNGSHLFRNRQSQGREPRYDTIATGFPRLRARYSRPHLTLSLDGCQRILSNKLRAGLHRNGVVLAKSLRPVAARNERYEKC